LDSARERMAGEFSLEGSAEAMDHRADLRLAWPIPRRSKDYERNAASSEAMIYIAMTHIMLRRFI
jgi:hypothetical protein